MAMELEEQAERQPEGATGIDALIEELNGTADSEGTNPDRQLDLSVRAAEDLGRMGSDAAPAEVHLANALEAESPVLRRRAAWALGRIGVLEQATVRALIAALTDEDELMRAEAAESLGHLGEAADFAATELSRVLVDDPSPAARRWAVWAYSQVCTDGGAAVDLLVPVLENDAEDSDVRREAAEALGRLGLHREEVLDALHRAAGVEDSSLARYAHEALCRLGASVEESTADEQPAANDDAGAAVAQSESAEIAAAATAEDAGDDDATAEADARKEDEDEKRGR